jgi:predicted acetyltransferase
MANIYLKFSTLEDKDKWLEYIEEYRLDNPKAKPLGFTKDINYEEWLNKITNEHNGIDLEEGRVPSSVYFLMNDEQIVGNLSIRHNINNNFLTRIGGHIGYGVRPSERSLK